MPWFKVDDNLAFHAKTVRAGNAAMGLWVRAGSWCSQHLTDGHVPDHIVTMLGTRPQADRLVASGLWDRETGGFRFHEWDERQPNREAIEAERAAARERMRSARAKKKGTIPASPQVSDVRAPELPRTGSDAFALPDPTRPDPTHKERADKPPAARKRAFPADFEPNDTNRRLAAERNLDLDSVVAQFRDHHEAVGNRFVDWHKALNTWLRREKPAPAAQPVRQLPHARDLELPPDGLSPAEYAEWDRKQRERRRA